MSTPIYNAAQASKIKQAWADRARKRNLELLSTMPPIEVELPDGPPVMAIRGNLLTVLEAGRIPDGLTPFVWEMIASGRQNPAEVTEKLIIDNWKSWVKTLDAMWFACVVEPAFFIDLVAVDPENPESQMAVVPVPPGFEPYSAVTVNDKVAFFNWCQGVSDYLAAFRDQEAGPSRPVAPVPGLPEVHAGGAPGASALPGAAPIMADKQGHDGMGAARGRKAGGARGNRGQSPQA